MSNDKAQEALTGAPRNDALTIISCDFPSVATASEATTLPKKLLGSAFIRPGKPIILMLEGIGRSLGKLKIYCLKRDY